MKQSIPFDWNIHPDALYNVYVCDGIGHGVFDHRDPDPSQYGAYGGSPSECIWMYPTQEIFERASQ